MSEDEKKSNDRRNAETPPFSFRFANKRIKASIERMARRNHRTTSGEINAILDEAVRKENA